MRAGKKEVNRLTPVDLGEEQAGDDRSAYVVIMARPPPSVKNKTLRWPHLILCSGPPEGSVLWGPVWRQSSGSGPDD